MSTIGRLWRRAPAWRLCLGAAIASTALAAMFPPTLPRWPLAHPPFGTGAPPEDGTGLAAEGGKDPAARYVPQPDPVPPDYETITSPPLGPDRTGMTPFAGRQLPLPSGNWQELILARSGGALTVQVALFGRMEDRHLTGLMLAAAPDPLSRAGPVTGLAPCFAPDAIAHQIVPAAAGQDPMSRECWTLTPFDTTNASRSRLDEVMRSGFDRLDQMGIAIPDHMLGFRYLRSDETGWFTALLLLPDRSPEPSGANRRLENWLRRFATLFHKGFDGALTTGDLSPAVVHDPD